MNLIDRFSVLHYDLMTTRYR